MAAIDYLCLGGIEIANNARTVAYARNGLKPHTMQIRDCGCGDLAAILGDPEYRLPALDTESPPAWVDPAVPESWDFAGLLVTGIDGLDSAPMTREVTDRTGDGAVIGRRRYGPRSIVVTGLLIGGSCCAIDYGMRWLGSALRGSMVCGAGAGCSGDDLRFLSCCPDICEDSPGFTSYEECAEPYWRTLREVALTSPLEKTGTVGASCTCCRGCPAAEVQFGLTAGRPHALREPITVTAAGESWTADDTESACVTWLSEPCPDDPEGCGPGAPSCLDAALAEMGCAPTAPPALPVPVNPCSCEPLTRRRHCVSIPSSVLTPIWSDVVADLAIYAGSATLRGVRVRFFPNPLGLGIDQLDPCGWCAEINAAVIPASATLRVDGTRRAVTVTCPGTDEVPASGAVTGAGGAPYSWPVLDCGVPYIACFEADAATIADDARITVRVISREV